MTMARQLEALDAPAHIARVRLLVRDLARVTGFYRDVLGLLPTETGQGCSLAAADGTVLVELVANPKLENASPTSPGLFHAAFVLPARRDLANWVAHAQSLGVRIEGATDHLVSEAIYLSDPEGNGIEIYVDRPRATWPRDGEMIRMATLALNGALLMAEQEKTSSGWQFPAGGRIGHVHLRVNDLALAESFYREKLGLTVMARYPGASFLGWGGYHHHIAINVWQSKGAAASKIDEAGLAAVSIAATGASAWARPTNISDPSGNKLELA